MKIVILMAVFYKNVNIFEFFDIFVHELDELQFANVLIIDRLFNNHNS